MPDRFQALPGAKKPIKKSKIDDFMYITYITYIMCILCAYDLHVIYTCAYAKHMQIYVYSHMICIGFAYDWYIHLHMILCEPVSEK